MSVPHRARFSLQLLSTLLLTVVLLAVVPSAGTPAAAATLNHLDADTQGLEGGTGKWAPWFLTGTSRSTAKAKSGSASLRVDITGLFGWGASLNNWPGFAATPGDKQIGFWALKGVGNNVGVSMRVKWRNNANVDLQTDVVSVPLVSTTWQRATADVVAPTGTTKVWIELVNSPGSSFSLLGDHLFLDEFVVGDRAVPVTTTTAAPTTTTAPPTTTTTAPPPPTGVVTNRLGAETQGIETNTGSWTTWFSTSIGRSTTQARAGVASLRVDLTAPYGWGTTLKNWPGFAATPGNKQLSFWGMKGTGSTLGVTMRVIWRNGANADLRTDLVTIPSLGTTWQQATTDVVAPTGTTKVWVEMVNGSGAGSGTAGDFLFLDEIVVGDVAATVPVGDPPPPTTPPTIPPASGAPATPPAPMCGSTALNGPSSPPAGSVRVDPGQNVYDATLANPAGTTFWLAPGVHRLEATMFGQVAAKTGNTYIGGPGAVLDGQGINRYAFTHVAPHLGTNVTVKNLTIQNFVAPMGEGVVNQGSGRGWVVEYNTIRNNGGAGVFIGSDNIVRNNCITANSQYGFSMALPEGLTNIVVDRNEISYNNTGDWETRMPGCGCSGAGKFWDVNGAAVTNNWVHHNKSVGLWADTNNIAFRIEGNYINDNDGQAIFYEISYNFLIKDNTIKRNTWATGRAFAARGDYFPVGTIYIAESGGDARVSATYAASEIVGNVLEDNWGGVVLWESANRFCNSPNNTSTGYCTKGGAATFATCAPPSIAAEPYYSDCRWKTQNITVHNNTFRHSATAVGCSTYYCGKQGLFSDLGSSPDWMPYKGSVIQQAVTYDRNNRFRNNTYVGDWSFTAFDRNLAGGFSEWQGPPYNQDAGSTKA